MRENVQGKIELVNLLKAVKETNYVFHDIGKNMKKSYLSLKNDR